MDNLGNICWVKPRFELLIRLVLMIKASKVSAGEIKKNPQEHRNPPFRTSIAEFAGLIGIPGDLALF